MHNSAKVLFVASITVANSYTFFPFFVCLFVLFCFKQQQNCNKYTIAYRELYLVFTADTSKTIQRPYKGTSM